MKKTLILPFIVKATNEKEDLSFPVELACVAYMAESQRKKTSLIRDKPEKISFISKVYYTLWVVPVDNSSLIIDGMSNSAHEFTFEEPTKTGTFIEELKKNSTLPEKFMEAVQAQTKATKEFSSPVKLSFKAIVDDRDLLNFFTEYFQSGKLQSEEQEKAVLIPTEIDEKAAEETAQAFVNALRTMQADAKGLQNALAVLKEEVEFHRNASENEIEKLKEKCDQEISIQKPIVDKDLKKITQKHEKTIATLQKIIERKLIALDRKREKFMTKLQIVEQRKDAAQRRVHYAKKKSSRSSSGSFALKKYEKEIDKTKKEIKAVSDEIDKYKKEGDSSLKQKEEEFHRAVTQEENKIIQINNAYNAKIALKQKQNKDITNQTEAIISELQSGIDELKRSSTTLKSQVQIAWKTDDTEKPIRVNLPVYIVKYAKDKEEERHNLLSPIIIFEETKLIAGLKKMLTSEPKIKTLMNPASKNLQDTINANFTQKIQNDPAFRMSIEEICRINNLINLNTFPQTLNEGLDEIERKGWMKSEEASTLCRRIMGEEA